ncbi:hypothetical protein J1781_09235 [Rahnella sp. C60]|uniref:hypothetical protein n=2 Tax=Rahnella perminowiae TaxID=2816244 RepID=UPI001C268FDF|nr:hypothetical protein [Rahnella perminowiae]MBU9808392.1 hypothetical protein [Rahnella perminowiae]MBU9815032.1 hypothetical protein [Rahnella perminowiae]
MEVTGPAMETGVMAGMQDPVLMEMEETGEAAARKEVMEETAAAVMERGTEEMGAMLVPEARAAREEAAAAMEVTTVLQA